MDQPPDQPPDQSVDPWARFRGATRARIGLERAGDALPTAALLEFQLAHAHARDAVHGSVDFARLGEQIAASRPVLRVHSAAPNRASYLRRPDLGRRLDEASRTLLTAQPVQTAYDVVFVVADGLSSAAINDHATAMLETCLAALSEWTVAPIILAEQARVALADEVAMLVNARMSVTLIGERPGLSVANSLGVYLTWAPAVGHRDSDRNCISNIHQHGLSYAQAAAKLVWLMAEARRLQLTGIGLKENASEALIAAGPAARLGNPPGRS